MDEGTQQNAALVEQTSAASQSMADQARGLKASMQKYRVNAAAVSEPEPVEEASAEPAAPAVERRKASRPWSAKRPAPAVAVAPAKRVANDEDSATWKEF